MPPVDLAKDRPKPTAPNLGYPNEPNLFVLTENKQRRRL